MPKVSIVIATYNSCKTIRDALDSVFNQMFQDWECIIIDGASKDNTLEIVRSYCNDDSRFKCISEPDRGIYDAFNKGWKLATGDWVLYLGSDDKLTKRGLFELFACIDESYDIVSGNAIVVYNDGSTKRLSSSGFSGSHQSKLMKRFLFEKFNGFDETYKICADKDLMVRLNNSGVSIKNYPIDIAFFYMGGVSTTFRLVGTKSRDLYSIYKKDNSLRYPFFHWLSVTCRLYVSQLFQLLLKK